MTARTIGHNFVAKMATAPRQKPDLLKVWPQSGPQELWRLSIRVGYSGMVLVNGRVFTMDLQEALEYLVCINADSGEELWRTEVDSIYRDSMEDGPRSIPSMDGENVFTVSGNGRLSVTNAETGRLVWRLDLKEELGFQSPDYWWSFSGSPFIDGDLRLLNVGGAGERFSRHWTNASN